MQNEITCPKCSHTFTLNEVMNEEMNTQLKAMRLKLNEDAAAWKKQREEEFALQIKLAGESAKKKAVDEMGAKVLMMEKEAL